MGKLKLHWQILIAIFLAILAGILTTPESALLGVTVTGIYDFMGTMFLNALRMLIVPLIMSSIISGVARTGFGKRSGAARSQDRVVLHRVQPAGDLSGIAGRQPRRAGNRQRPTSRRNSRSRGKTRPKSWPRLKVAAPVTLQSSSFG